MSHWKLPELELFRAVLKCTCLVPLLVYVFWEDMVSWWCFNKCLLNCMESSKEGDTNGFGFCNCHVVVRGGANTEMSPCISTFVRIQDAGLLDWTLMWNWPGCFIVYSFISECAYRYTQRCQEQMRDHLPLYPACSWLARHPSARI